MRIEVERDWVRGDSNWVNEALIEWNKALIF